MSDLALSLLGKGVSPEHHQEVPTLCGLAEDAVSQGQWGQGPPPLLGSARLQKKGKGRVLCAWVTPLLRGGDWPPWDAGWGRMPILVDSKQLHFSSAST